MDMSNTVGSDQFSGKIEWLKYHGITDGPVVLAMIAGERVYNNEVYKILKEGADNAA